MSDSPFEEGNVSVTLKHNGKYEDPWVVFHGSPARIREQIIEFFDMGTEVSDDASVANVVYEANKIASREYNAAQQLGGVVISTNKPGAKSQPKAQGETKPAATDDKSEFIAGKIASAPDMDSLTDVWGDYATEIKADENLMAAFKARGKALKSK